MPNFGSIINSHNKKIINSNIPKQPASTCNCRLKSSCPLNGNCMQSSLVYICKADTPNIIQNHPHYIGLTEILLKTDFTSIKTYSNGKVNAMQRSYQILYGKTNIQTLKLILCGIYQIKLGCIDQKPKDVYCA